MTRSTWRTATLTFALTAVTGALLFWQNKHFGASSGADPSAITKADKAFDGATAAHGEEGFRSFIADDMTTIRENQEIVRGKEQFVAGWKPVFTSPGLGVRWQPQLGRISDDGTLGFTVGTYQTVRKQAGSQKTVGSGKYVTIWRKQSDGSWKAIFDSGVNDTPPGAR